MTTEPRTTQHTPEPWEVDRPAPGNNPMIVAEDGRDVALVYDGYLHGDPTGAFPSAMIEANALRIVAAVNACAGIPTELLKSPDAGKASRIHAALVATQGIPTGALERGVIRELLAALKAATYPEETN